MKNDPVLGSPDLVDDLVDDLLDDLETHLLVGTSASGVITLCGGGTGGSDATLFSPMVWGC